MDNSLENLNTNSFDCVTNAVHLLDKLSEIEAENVLDPKITVGMQALRVSFSNEEQDYIKDMLKKHPVVMESRKTSAVNTAYDNVQTMQRAEICRKSRINHKTRKTQVSYRHQFAVEKVGQSMDLHSHLQGMIADAEKQLLENGFQPDKLKQMREQFGLGIQQHQPQPKLNIDSISNKQSPIMDLKKKE